MKVPFIVYSDLACLLKKCTHVKIIWLAEQSSTTKINMHMPSGYSLFTNCLFDSTKNKLDCLEIFWKDIIEQATRIINYEKKEMILLTDKENKSYEKQK